MHDPNDASLYNLKGRSLWLLSRYEEALEALEKAIQLDPSNASAHCNNCLVLRWLNRIDEALAVCDKVIELAPNSHHLSKAMFLKELGRDEESLQLFRYVTELDPNNVNAWANIWDILSHWSLKDEAQRTEATQAYLKAKELGGYDLILLEEYDPYEALIASFAEGYGPDEDDSFNDNNLYE